MNKVTHARTICPFFRSDSPKSIACEGLTEESQAMRTEFTSSVARQRHQERYCFRFCYDCCPIARAINSKYKGGDAE